MHSKNIPLRPWPSFVLAGVLLLATPTLAQTPVFTDEAANTGLDFTHFNGMSGERYFSEIVGPGAALFDMDGDGDLDVYAVQGKMLGRGKTIEDATLPPRHPLRLTDRLYRNDLANGELKFTDVTEKAGLTASEYGMGVAAGDVDNDGDVDLYVTNFGPNQFLVNQGDGTFVDATEKAGVGEPRWSTSAAFLDYDHDGWLDLFVANYVMFNIANHTNCPKITGEPGYCGPLSYPPESDRLFRNRGDGTFEDVTREAGLGGVEGSGLGVVAADFNADGWVDVYVANDLMHNQLWLNQKDGTFFDEGLLSGSSASGTGELEASMGVIAGDFDGDGDEDLFMAHLGQQTNTIYLNDGQGMFTDASVETGLGPPSWKYTGFGTALFDYDNDGWLDMMVVNGAVKELEALLKAEDPFPLHEPNQLFRNLGKGRFEETTANAGKVFELSEVSRGAVSGDVDNDGDTDVLVLNNGGPARLMINHLGNSRHWLGLRLVDPRYSRDALGARATLYRADGSRLVRTARTDGSYLSSGDPRVLFGLGESPAFERVRVQWPDGLVEEWSRLEADAYHALERGSGEAVKEKAKDEKKPTDGADGQGS